MLEIEILYEYFKTKNYGELISHEEIENIIQIKRNRHKYYKIIAYVKDKLVSDSKIIKAIPGIGYQILKTKHVSGYVYRTNIYNSQRQLSKATKILSNLKTEGFNKDRIEEYNDIKELTQKLNKISTKTIAESKYVDRMSYYNSLED